MSQSTNTNRKQAPTAAGLVRRWWWAPAIVVAVIIAIATMGSGPSDAAIPTGDLVAAERGPLSVRVTSNGAIRSDDAVLIKNRVEGMSTILWIIEEGSHVEAGEKLLELDSSELMDEKLEEEIEVETSRASHINAELVLEITRQQGQADIEASDVAYRLALLDLEKYAGITAEQYERFRTEGRTLANASEGSVLAQLNELAPLAARDESYRQEFRTLLEQIDGTYKQEVKRGLNNIIISDAVTQRAQDQYDGSNKLFEKGYITETELEADSLDYQRAVLDQDVAAGELELLVRFTYKRTMEELLSAVSQSRFDLEKAKNEAQANIVDAEANLNARRERLVRDEQHLREINEQIAASTITAPASGMVVYGTTGKDLRDREEPLAEGVEVRERMDLIRLPKTDSLVADLKIHESLLQKISTGLPVRITTDALPGHVYEGRITKIALLPDAQQRWLNPDLKVYDTTVELIGDTDGLRTGMSCKAEIIVEEFEDALYVPIQTVVRVGMKPMVYVPAEGGGLRAQPVEIGLDDNQVIQIVSGLDAGDMVSLIPPLQEGQRPLRSQQEQKVSAQVAPEIETNG